MYYLLIWKDADLLSGVIITKYLFITELDLTIFKIGGSLGRWEVISLIMLEPYAVKAARTVLRGGKLELAYLSQPQIAAIM